MIMTRSERLVSCKQCKNRYLDFNKGLLCNLTGKEADFEGECQDFEQDVSNTYIRKPKEAIRPNTNRALWAQYLIWAILGFSLFSLLSSYLQYDLLLKVQEGFYVSEHELTNNDLREGVVGIITIVLYVTSVILFIRWFRRAYYNLNSRGNTTYDEGWAAGSWFVPIINLFRPYQIMKEIDDENCRLIEKHSQKPISKSSILIGFWWAAWIIGGILGRYIFKSGLNAETLEELMASTQADMLGIVFDVPLSLLAIFTIREISKKEDLLFQLEEKSLEKTQA
ncbi:MAG: hypothetical protein Tsb004_21540 [Allomuricauda sp.]